MSRWNLLFLAGLIACGGDDGGGGTTPMPLPDDVRPSKRSDIAAVGDSASNSIVVFGGDDGPIVNQRPMPMYRGDTWVLDLEDGWTELSPSTAPSPRGRYSVGYDPAGRMMLFGGRFRDTTSGPYTLSNDLWAFDYASREWSMLSDGAGGPAARYFSTSAYDQASGTFYVYGGGTNSDPVSLLVAQDLWSFDGQAWTEETATGQAPSPRLFMAYAYDSSRNRLLVYGGQVGDFVSPGLADLYALDLNTKEWTQLHAGMGNAPTGRFSAMLSYDAAGDRYIMFGGHADPGVANDVWSFDPNAGTWTKLGESDSFTGSALGCLGNPREIPKEYVSESLTSPERRSGAAMTIMGDNLVVFGGESDCSDHLDDVWQFDLQNSTWTESIEAQNGESCGRRGDDCTCLCL